MLNQDLKEANSNQSQKLNWHESLRFGSLVKPCMLEENFNANQLASRRLTAFVYQDNI